ncbi:MAG: TrkH family potassium uptake protein [Planctomycetes bacterium]|nr:TrkH family potassium uptake protein [Planctomycetota bacterium]
MREHLKQRYGVILSYVGSILILTSVVALTPLILLLAEPTEATHAMAFVLPAILMALLGMLLWLTLRQKSDVALSVQEGGVIVLISWLFVVAFSAWPFITVTGLDFSQAFFESMSGWTTTGLSVVDVTSAPKSILIWRSIIQLAGGAGLAILMMSAIVGPTGAGIASAEGRSDQLVPHVRRSARLVLIIYGCYAALGTVAYYLAGMPIFDAVNHSFAAVSTGGFSTRTESIGYYDSILVEAVTFPLMILGNLSFVTAWYLWRGKFRTVLKNGEVRLMAFVIPISIALVFFLTCQELYIGLEKSVRVSMFEIVTAITTTGFSTVGYGDWNAFGLCLMIALMLIGGGTCSTAGGIKQFRIYILIKALVWDIRAQLLPRTVVQPRPVWDGNRRSFLDDSKLRAIFVFVFLYLATYGLGVLLLCASGYSLPDSLFEFASALGTVGLSVGVTSAKMPVAALWAETIAMFLGRLEFIVVVVSVMKLASDVRASFKTVRKEHQYA